MPERVDHRSLVLWAADCAEHVLPHFEDRRPDDDRPRLAIDAARAWVRGEVRVSHARAAAFEAHDAARFTDQGSAARAAARAAGHAAATTHVPSHAAIAARYAVSAVVAAISEDAAGVDEEAAEIARAGERAWQLGRLPEHLRKDIDP